MIRVFFADDDILTLNKLSSLLNWDQLGYEVAGQARNGSECLAAVEKLKPDILLLDIDMPEKNGVEVSRELHRTGSTTSILILSNYDNYDFVRDAMRYGAFDYLLKHQLTTALLKDKLDEIKQYREREGLISSRLTYFATVAKQQYLKELILYGITNPTEHSHMKTQAEFASSCNVLAVMQITNFILVTHFSPAMNREKLIESIMTLATNIFTTLHTGLITHMEHGQFAILFHYSGEASSAKAEETTRSCMQLLTSNIRRIFNLSAIHQVSSIFSDFKKTCMVYQHTLKLLTKQTFQPGGQEKPPVSNAIEIMLEKELMNALSSLDLAQAEVVLKNILTTCTGHGQHISQQVIYQLIQLGIRFQQSHHLEPVRSYDRQLQSRAMEKMGNDDTFRFILDYYKLILTNALGQINAGYSVHIRNTICYIRENYKHDISLATAAEEIHISHSHLSRLFKQETGTSFVDYLTSMRIQAARNLMQNTSLDLKEIAEQTGFSSYNYFLRVYKEKSGKTPTQEIKEMQKL